MNSPGGTRVNDVLEYILNEDGLWKYIKDARHPRKKSEEPPTKARELIEIVLVSSIPEEGTEIILQPEMTLAQCKKYFFDLINLDGKSKHMPLLYLSLIHI